ncbi:MAG: Cna B-type domain-containing protein [Chloroflexi bacterium]|nr:Cna B-type domain-containing protein [Chloroflexota bacterium]
MVTGPPFTDNDGNTSTYNVRETDAYGNDYTPENYVKTYDGLTVTNKYVSPTKDVVATKVWKGGPAAKPTIRLQLYRNGVAFGSPVDLVHPNTTYTWKDLDRTDQNAKAYTYTVDEVAVPANYSKSVVGLTITNTYVGGTKPPEVPYTGDASNALLYGVLALSSLAGFGAVTVAKRRKKK